MKCVDTVTQQQKLTLANELLCEKTQPIQSSNDFSGAIELTRTSGQIASDRNIMSASEKLEGKVNIKKANTTEQTNPCANYKDPASQTKRDEMEKDGMISTIELNIHSNTEKTQNGDGKHVETLEIVNDNYKTSEIVNENYIFSSLSLVDNEFIDNKALE